VSQFANRSVEMVDRLVRPSGTDQQHSARHLSEGACRWVDLHGDIQQILGRPDMAEFGPVVRQGDQDSGIKCLLISGLAAGSCDFAVGLLPQTRQRALTQYDCVCGSALISAMTSGFP
jgi:hypothetical protein